ncbi:MAG: PilZ domain-containing protein [Treponema sp.]|nr:PilZ domain-containing protein [Treponema sp.]
MLDILIMHGFEAYTLKDHKRALRLIEHFGDSILFINIDEGLSEPEWESYIYAIQNNEKTKGCRIGILSYNNNAALMQKYLMELAVPCGYIQLKLGLQESTRIIVAALEANEARGRRKYIRAVCEDDVNAILNFKGPEGILFHGKLLDISAVGVAARIDQPFDIAPSTLINDVQMRLRGGIVRTNLIAIGKRQGNDNVWIFLMNPAQMEHETKLIIHRFIKHCLQRYIDQLQV